MTVLHKKRSCVLSSPCVATATRQIGASLKSVKAVVMYRGEVPEGLEAPFAVYTWDQFMEVSFAPAMYM